MSADASVVDADLAADKVIGRDDRKLIGDPSAGLPFRAIGKVQSDFDGDGIYDFSGTGAMIGPNDVLTAGHMLWNSTYGMAKQIWFTPALNGDVAPFGTATAKSWYVPESYINSKGSLNYDVGVINLTSNVGNSTGWLSVKSTTATQVDGTTVAMAGYPADLGNFKRMYLSSDNVDFTSENTMLYNGKMDSYGGMSGSPLFWTNNGEYSVIGVHTFQALYVSYNGGTIINSTLYNLIKGWSSDTVGDPVSQTPIATTPADGADSLTGSNANETLSGGAGADTIIGAGGDDVLYGNVDVDLLYGSDGNDTLFGGQNGSPADSDGIFRQGMDTLYGGNGADMVLGNYGSDLLYGDAGADSLYGGRDNDTLFGNDDADLLSGDFGDDVLYGDSANTNGVGAADTIYGGGGTDTVVYSGSYASYTFVRTGSDSVVVSGMDVLSGVEWLRFSDRTVGFELL